MGRTDNIKNRKLKIVLFYHDGPEHITNSVQGSDANKIIKINGKNIIPWHNVLPHRRKFIFCNGKYIDKDNIVKEGDLGFWGEWEAPSEFISIKNVTVGYPNYIHTLLYIQDITKDRSNTDPYIFGQRFKYCCCKQNRENMMFLRNLVEGSIILFGAKKGGEFILDTVFIVDSFINYDRKSVEKLFDKKVITEPFYLTSLKPLKDSSSDKMHDSYTLYASKMHSDNSGIYSFFPCKAARNGDVSTVAFSRPILDIKKFCLSKGKKGGLSGQGCNGDILTIYKERNKELLENLDDTEVIKLYWDMLKNEIFEQDLCLGIFAKEPTSTFDMDNK